MAYGEFSVYQWFMDGQYEAVLDHVDPAMAVKKAMALINSVGGRMGTTVRVIITDGGDCINFEWKFGEGIVYGLQDSGYSE